MKKETILGLSGLILAGLAGCETNRPYSGHYAARNTYPQADMAYRPRTTVTMRAEEVPDNPTTSQTCPAVQVVSPTGATVVQATAQGSSSSNMVTVNIPAMKIMVPVSALTANSSTASSTPQVQEVSSVSHLPPASSSGVVHADSKTTTSSSAALTPPPDIKVQSPPAHSEKEETVSASCKKVETPAMPEPIKESKTKSESESKSESKPISKSNESDSHQPRLSLLPPDPPPDVHGHRTTPSSSARKSIPEMPPPPPPIPKSADSNGPALPSADPEVND
jgi:hypothetical protein